MEELVYLKKDEAVCTSIEVAQNFDKKHKVVLKAIENIIGGMPKNVPTPLFIKKYYMEEQNKQRYPMYEMNRDGFSLLVMGFTGKKSLEWKLKYIQAFNQMESIIKEKTTATWLENRKQGMLTRRSETDVIKNLIEYAKEQGSTHANMLYMTYSKLAKKMMNVSNRDTATTVQLNQLNLAEHIIINCIKEGMEQGDNYKKIYQNCEKRLMAFKDIAYL